MAARGEPGNDSAEQQRGGSGESFPGTPHGRAHG